MQAQLASDGSVPVWASTWNGFRMANASIAQLKAVERDRKTVLTVPDDARTAALAAYAREPLATKAVAVLGITSTSRSDAILEKSRELDKRNEAVAAVLLQRAAERRDTPKILEMVDTLARRSPESAKVLVGALSSTLADPQSFSIVDQALATSPPWEEAFWRLVPERNADLDAFYRLRTLRRSVQTTKDADNALMRALVSRGRFAEAFEFRRFAGAEEAEVPQALEWQLTGKGQVSARQRPDGTIAIHVQPGAGGELGRRLFSLSPDQYVISAKTAGQRGDGELSFELACAEPGKSQRGREFALGEMPARFEIQSATCHYWWLVLKGSAWNSSVPFKADLSNPVVRVAQ